MLGEQLLKCISVVRGQPITSGNTFFILASLIPLITFAKLFPLHLSKKEIHFTMLCNTFLLCLIARFFPRFIMPFPTIVFLCCFWRTQIDWHKKCLLRDCTGLIAFLFRWRTPLHFCQATVTIISIPGHAFLNSPILCALGLLLTSCLKPYTGGDVDVQSCVSFLCAATSPLPLLWHVQIKRNYLRLPVYCSWLLPGCIFSPLFCVPFVVTSIRAVTSIKTRRFICIMLCIGLVSQQWMHTVRVTRILHHLHAQVAISTLATRTQANLLHFQLHTCLGALIMFCFHAGFCCGSLYQSCCKLLKFVMSLEFAWPPWHPSFVFCLQWLLLGASLPCFWCRASPLQSASYTRLLGVLPSHAV